MTPELTVLALAALLQAAQFTLMAVPANLEMGPGKTLSPRDTSRMDKPMVDQVSDTTARLIRAMNNHFEALILFTIAVVVITLGDKRHRPFRPLRMDLFGRAHPLCARILFRPRALAFADLVCRLPRNHADDRVSPVLRNSRRRPTCPAMMSS